ncbi:MAG: RNA polymerase sigma factor [Microbacterium sp.]|nr:RNA polymerase sigma factor [Microbacterium sp.]
MSTDSDIIRRSRDDARAFAELYDRHARPITGFAIRRVGEHAADDIVNETFLTAFRRLSAYDMRQESALPWLFGIASNMVRRHRAQEARHWRVLAQLPAWREEPGEDTEGSDRALDARRELARLAPAIGSLSMRDREALLLYATGELTYDEIARALGVPVGTIRSRLNRVRRHIAAHGAPRVTLVSTESEGTE